MPKTVILLGLKEASQATDSDRDRWERLKSAVCPKCNNFGYYYTYLYLSQYCWEKNSKNGTEREKKMQTASPNFLVSETTSSKDNTLAQESLASD